MTMLLSPKMSSNLLAAMLLAAAATFDPAACSSPLCEYDENRRFLDCSFRGFSVVPTSQFPSHVLAIDLNSNRIYTLTNRTFSEVPDLEYLDLSNNDMYRMQISSFEGLGNLMTLNLSYNSFGFSVKDVKPGLFEPLVSLREIRMQGDWADPKWQGIDSVFSPLKNLTKLFLDLPHKFIFEKGFGNLTKLRVISTHTLNTAAVNGCNMRTVKNSTFEVFTDTPVRELRLVDCQIDSIENGAFKPLRSLELLDLSNNNDLGLRPALHSLQGLQGNKMTGIKLHNLNGPFARKWFVLDQEDFAYLAVICVTSIDLSRNFIAFTDDPKKPIKLRYDCIEHLNMSHHALGYLPSEFFKSLKPAKGLKYMDFSHGYDSSLEQGPPRVHADSGGVDALPTMIPLPANLLWFSFSSCGNWVNSHTTLSFLTVSNLQYLGVANLNLANCYRPLTRGVESLKSLDISGNICKFINPIYFEDIENITTLKLSDWPNLNLMSSEKAFSSLEALEKIDLSGNKLDDVHPRLFNNNKRLRTINLADNKLQRVPRAIWDITSLQQLDLSYNAFTHFSLDEMRRIDEWITKPEPFQLLFDNNPLQCTCDTVVFIRWLLQRALDLDGVDNNTCLLSNGTRSPVSRFAMHLTDFEVKCVSETYLVISVVGTMTLLVLILLFAGMYRYRLNLRYWLYSKLHPPENMFVNRHYTYDAFVAYTEDDYEWVIGELRPKLELGDEPIQLCLHDRDFVPGMLIHENIVDKLRESRKILFIISRGFLSSRYGPLEIEYAGMKSVEEGRDDVILCVLMEDIPVRQMSKTLRNLWHKITFLKWSTNPQEQNIFWRNLKGALSRPRE